MYNIGISNAYREYLMGFLEEDFERLVDTEVLSFKEFIDILYKNSSV